MDEAHILIELQDRDLQILRLNKQLDDMPEKRSILAARGKIAELETLLARNEAAAQAIDANVKRLEDEMTNVNGKIESEQAKLLSGEVKNPKELQAISLELAGLKRRSDKLENEVLSAMTKRETAGEQAAKIKAVIETGRAKEAELVAHFKDRGGALLKQIDALNSQRVKLTKGLPAELRGRYESLRESRKGIAVGQLEETSCSVCRVSLPAEQLDRLLSGPDVATCPKCHRMLVVRKPESV